MIERSKNLCKLTSEVCTVINLANSCRNLSKVNAYNTVKSLVKIFFSTIFIYAETSECLCDCFNKLRSVKLTGNKCL